MDSSDSHNRLYLGIFIAVILALGGIGLLLVLNMKKNQLLTVNSPQSTVNRLPSTDTSPSPLPKPIAGSFMLQVQGGKSEGTVGKPLVLVLLADSNNADITGYDALLQFDVKNFEVSDVHSIVTDFGLMQYVKEGNLIITGIKNIGTPTAHIWKNQEIATVSLVPKTKGSYTFSLVKDVGKRTTKFVDINTKLIYPETGSVTVTVQ